MKNNPSPFFLRVLLAAFFALSLLPLSARAQSEKKNIAFDAADETLFRKMKAETKKDDSQVYQELGFSYFKQEMFDRAMFYFRKAIVANPAQYWSWYYMGLMRLESAEPYFKKAIEANRKFAPAYYWLARYYCKDKNIKESLRYFGEYMKVAQRNPEEAERIEIAKKFLAQMNAGETDFDKIMAAM